MVSFFLLKTTLSKLKGESPDLFIGMLLTSFFWNNQPLETISENGLLDHEFDLEAKMDTLSPNKIESSDNASLFDENEIESLVSKRTYPSFGFIGMKKYKKKIYIKCSGSTGNAISHLRNKHDIIKDGKIDK
ncbi:hypothetical protein C1645_746346, partial [Glomus cerebriforme]